MDALSRKPMGSMVHVHAKRREMTRELHQLASIGIQLMDSNDGGVIEVKKRQYKDPVLERIREGIQQKKAMTFELGGDGILIYRC